MRPMHWPMHSTTGAQSPPAARAPGLPTAQLPSLLPVICGAHPCGMRATGGGKDSTRAATHRRGCDGAIATGPALSHGAGPAGVRAGGEAELRGAGSGAPAQPWPRPRRRGVTDEAQRTRCNGRGCAINAVHESCMTSVANRLGGPPSGFPGSRGGGGTSCASRRKKCVYVGAVSLDVTDPDDVACSVACDDACWCCVWAVVCWCSGGTSC